MILKNTLSRWRAGVVAAGLLSALLLSMLATQNSLPADAEAPALPADLATIPNDAIFLASLRFADVWNSDVTKPVRQKLAKEINEGAREFEKKYGLSPDQVERLTMVFLNIGGPGEPLSFVGTTKADDRNKVIATSEKAKEQYKGKTFYLKDERWAVYPLGERALVYGHPHEIRGLIDHPAKRDGQLASARSLAAGKHSAVIAVNVKAINDQVGEQLPGEIEPFKPMLQALYGTLAIDLGAEVRADVKLAFADEKKAKAAVEPARSGLELARQGIERGLEQISKEKEMNKVVELLKQLQESLKAVRVEQNGNTLQASARHKVDVATIGVVMMEGVQKVREAAARAQSQNNLKQIALAMHNYHDVHGCFPPQATYNKDGKPMLSWRVMILPYIEQNNLYNQFHLDEPWDSEHNKKLLDISIKTYTSPLQDEKSIKEHLTHYQGFVGKGAFFDGKQGIQIASITDGTSNTLMIVEASKGVPWTKPEDIPFDPAKDLPKLGLPGASGFQASLCDGSVRMISHKISKETLRNVITRDDGNVIGPDF